MSLERLRFSDKGNARPVGGVSRGVNYWSPLGYQSPKLLFGKLTISSVSELPSDSVLVRCQVSWFID